MDDHSGYIRDGWCTTFSAAGNKIRYWNHRLRSGLKLPLKSSPKASKQMNMLYFWCFLLRRRSDNNPSQAGCGQQTGRCTMHTNAFINSYWSHSSWHTFRLNAYDHCAVQHTVRLMQSPSLNVLVRYNTVYIHTDKWQLLQSLIFVIRPSW